MAATRISDLIVPTDFYPYFAEQTTKMSALIQSGLALKTEENDFLAGQQGLLTNLTFVKPYNVSSKGWKADGTNDTTAEGLKAATSVVPLLKRRMKFGFNQLATHISGANSILSLGRANCGTSLGITGDVSATIARYVAAAWNEDTQSTVLSILKGVFACTTNSTTVLDTGKAGMSGNKLDVSGATSPDDKLSPKVLAAAQAKLGDYGRNLDLLFVHSDVYYSLMQQNLTSALQIYNQEFNVPRYLGKILIADDTLPLDTSGAKPKYTSYLCSPGVIYYGDAVLPTGTGVELERDAGQTEDYLHTRKAMILHPMGLSYTGTLPASGEGPSKTDFANGANWRRDMEAKNIPIVEIITAG